MFQGLGDLVRELREWWKDLSWRNRFERAMAELDLEERRRELRLQD